MSEEPTEALSHLQQVRALDLSPEEMEILVHVIFGWLAAYLSRTPEGRAEWTKALAGALEVVDEHRARGGADERRHP